MPTGWPAGSHTNSADPEDPTRAAWSVVNVKWFMLSSTTILANGATQSKTAQALAASTFTMRNFSPAIGAPGLWKWMPPRS